MIGAILRAQWMSMRAFRSGGKPAGAIFSLITGGLFYGFWALIGFAAQAYLANPGNGGDFALVLPAALLAMFLYWQIAPVITATMGASLDLKKLLVYPIPHGQMFLIEVLLRVSTSGETLLVLAGVAIGILRNPAIGGIAAVPRVALAAGMFTGFNLLLSAGVRSLLERLLRRRRTRDLMIVLLVAISVTPQFLVRSHIGAEKVKALLRPMPELPWGAAARVLLGGGAVLPLALLILYGAAALWFGRRQFEAGLRYDGESARPRQHDESRRAGLLERFVRVPARLLPDPVGAVFEKEVLSLSRMPPFRMIFLMGSAVGVILWLPRVMNGQAAEPGFLNDNILTFASAYSILLIGQVTYFNCFGFDRSAAQAWFSLPVPIAKAILGKNLAAAFFIVLELCLALAVAVVLRVPVSGQRIADSFLVCLIAALYLISFGNVTSFRLPRGLNAEKMGQGGSSRALSALAMLFLPLLLMPIALAFLGRYLLRSDLAFYVLLGLALAFGAVLYWVSMDSAKEAAVTRREKLLTDLSRGDGPVASS